MPAATPSGGASAEQGGARLAPGAAFVAASGGEVYYWVGSRGWQEIPPLERVWFPNEAAAQEAGYRRAASAWEPLDEFEIIGELGRGGTSVVYHAWDRGLGREVAIKVIQPHFGSDPETALRFALEVRLLASLRHPNVVSAFAVKQLHGGGVALVMEYVRGRTLRDVIKQQGPLPPERTERILRDVASALAAAHQHGIVHRDVKPDNIFLEESTGRALLADFGIAVNVDNPSGLTMLGTAVGTPNYMSPEQIDGGALDGRSDLYSLALIGREMLTGERPWNGMTLYSVIYKQKNESLPPLRTVRPDVPVRLAYAIEGALSKDPAARWGSAQDFLRQLEDRSLPARWRQLSSAVLWKRRASARVAAATARIQSAAVETAKTVFFRRPDHPQVDARARLAARQRGRFGPRARLAAVAVGIGVALAVPAGLRSPFAASRAADVSPEGTAGVGASSSAAEPGSTEALSQVALAAEAADTPAGAEGALPGDPAQTGEAGGEVVGRASSDAPSDASADAPADPEPPADAGASAAPASAPPAQPPPVEANPLALPVATTTGPATLGTLLPAARSRSLIAAGGMHTCEIDSTQSVLCWGGNDRGQLGLGAPRRATTGMRVAAVSGVAAVEAGAFHSCALRSLGTTLCWGENADGQLGGGSAGEPGLVRISTHRFTSLSLGSAHSCGVSSDGAVHCWGSNGQGQLGDGTSAARSSPTPVLLEAPAAMVSAGWNHSCAVTRAGRGLCWGDNEWGQLGDGTTFDRFAPVRVAGNQLLRSIAAGSSHSCALTTAGEVFCWGQNSAGQLGDGTTAARSVPARVQGGARFVELSAGGRHTCALDSAGVAYCWGQNTYGQLGNGSTELRNVPTRVNAEVRFATIRSSGAHTCAVALDGGSYCWGYNVEGQIGDGTQTHRTTPQRVSR
jgi:alpha-tubulin suppressor-like RCC1 family protein